MTDEIGRRLGEQLAVIHDVDLDDGAGLVLEAGGELGQNRRELVVLRGDRQRHPDKGLLLSHGARQPRDEKRAGKQDGTAGHGRPFGLA